jgi:hypothetical protein
MTKPAPDGPPPGPLDDRGVIEQERKEIVRRRRAAFPGGNEAGVPWAPENVGEDLVGLALSGGGIRSAMFNLGLLQAFHHFRLLHYFDYLSTVSGGSYIGTQFSSQVRRRQQRQKRQQQPRPGVLPLYDDFPLGQGPHGTQPDRVLTFIRKGRYLERPWELAAAYLWGWVRNLAVFTSGLVFLCALLAILWRLADVPSVRAALTFNEENPRGWRHWCTPDLVRAFVPSLLFLAAYGVAALVARRATAAECRDAPPEEGPTRVPLYTFCRFFVGLVLWGVGCGWGWPVALPAVYLAAWGADRWATRAPAKAVRERRARWLRRARRWARVWFWFSLLVSAVVLLGNGDISLDPVSYLLPRRWLIYNPDYAEYCNLDIEFLPWYVKGPIYGVGVAAAAVVGGLSLLGLLLPRRLLASGQRPRSGYEVGVFRAALTALLLGVPLLVLYYLARENVSGQAAQGKMIQVESKVIRLVDNKVTPLETKGAGAGKLAGLEVKAVRLSAEPDFRDTDGMRRNLQQRFRNPPIHTIEVVFNQRVPWDWWDFEAGKPDADPKGRGGEEDRRPAVARVGGVAGEAKGAAASAAAENRGPPAGAGGGAAEAKGPGAAAEGDTAEAKELPQPSPLPGVSYSLLSPWEDERSETDHRKPLRLRAVSYEENPEAKTFTLKLRSLAAEGLPEALNKFWIDIAVTGEEALRTLELEPLDQRALIGIGAANRPNIARQGPLWGEEDFGPLRAGFNRWLGVGARSSLAEHDQVARLQVLLLAGVAFLVTGTLVNFNRTSLHDFYQERLTEAYVEPDRDRGVRVPLSQLDNVALGAPFHLISATLNLLGYRRGPERTWPFLFSSLYCGSEPTGYFRARGCLGRFDDLATVTAISGAALSPVQGDSLPLTFLMMLTNLRLGQWLPHPQNWGRLGWLLGWPTALCLALDALRDAEDRRTCFLTDGGHSENLGLWPLIQRRCKLIVVSDAGQDAGHTLEDFLKLCRRIRLHHGVGFLDLIEDRPVDLRAIRLQSDFTSRYHFFVGRVRYPEGFMGAAAGEEGYLIYVKPSLTRDEDNDLLHHFTDFRPFPHDPTAHQLFDQNKVESYRQLGFHIGEVLCRHLPRGLEAGPRLPVVDELFLRYLLASWREAEGDERKATQAVLRSEEPAFRREAAEQAGLLIERVRPAANGEAPLTARARPGEGAGP